VTPGYFRTMQIPLVAGRDFEPRDARMVDSGTVRDSNGVPPFRVAVVNESFARKYFGNRSPIGRHIGFGSNPGTKTPIEIVGVVKDAKYMGVRDEIRRTVYFSFMEDDVVGSAVMYVRTSNRPEAAFASILDVLHRLDPNIPLIRPRTMDAQLDESLLNERLVATLSTAFGGLATLLAVIGLYGVMAFTVSRRTREIGVRMALGAVPGDVIWLVMREVLVLVSTGIVLGLAGAAALNRVVGNQLYGVTPGDPLAIAGAAVVLASVALLAGYLPARRATRVNPVLALLYE